MKNIKILLTALLCTVAICMAPLVANAQIVWKLAHKQPPASPEGRAYQLFVDEVSKLSNKKMRIEIYPSEQLGAESVSLDMLRKETIHMYLEGLSYAHVFLPQLNINTLPFVFRDRDHWSKFMDSTMSKQWKDELIKKSGLSYLGNYGEFLRGPYRVLISKKPVLKLEDLRGLKLRMYKNEMVMSIWKELGANTILLAYSETYQALKTGLVEGLTNNLAQTEDGKFQEVGKYILQTDEFPQSIAFFINDKAYQSLPGDLKEVIQKAYKASCEYSQKVIPVEGEKSIDRMIQKDKVTFIRAPMGDFIKKVKPLYDKWEAEEKYGLTKGIIAYIEKL